MERTIGQGSPLFTADELDAIESFVAGGGGLVVLAEEEQDKYGNNLRELLGRFGVGVAHTTVRDPRHAHRDVATWVLAEPATTSGLLAGVRTACFYRTGVLTVSSEGAGEVLFATSPTADPAGAPLAAAVRYGKGRVVAFADSDLFGDDSIEDYDHRRLWGNVVHLGRSRPGRRRRHRVARRGQGGRVRPAQGGRRGAAAAAGQGRLGAGGEGAGEGAGGRDRDTPGRNIAIFPA